jgi:hypothetical protein
MELSISKPVAPTSWIDKLAGAGLFILWGGELILQEIPQEWNAPGWVESLRGVFFIGLILAPLVLILAWARSFPRWSYPYIVHLVLFSLYLSIASTPGLQFFGIDIFGREMWGWRAWVLPLFTILVSLFITRSLHPVEQFFGNIIQEWSLALFALSSMLPLYVAIAFDEMDRLYSLIFMVVLSLMMITMALLYMGGWNKLHRAIILVLGIAAVICIAQLAAA